VAVATVFFLVVSLESGPTTSSVSTTRPAPPSPEEVAVLEELLEWVGTRGKSFEAVRPNDVLAAIRDKPRSFELFRSFNRREDRLQVVLDMPYGEIIGRTAKRYRLDELLLAAMIEAESSFDPKAVSPVGALGLMQVMPATAGSYEAVELLNPRVNLDQGARYLSWLLERFEGDLELALAAYNAGPGAVEKYRGVPPYRETRAYLARVLSLYVDHHQQAWQQAQAKDWLLY
jgi:soluble lytic murein transglycosylase-like protein